MKKRNPLLISLCAVICIFILALVFIIGTSTTWGKVEITDLNLVTADGDRIHTLLYKPRAANADNKVPLAIIAHGGSDMLEQASGYAIELSRRGYAVVTYDYSHLTVLYILEAALFLHLEQIVGVALRCLGNDVLVHTVGTYTHDTAQTAGTEFEGTIEGVNEFGFVLRLHEGFYFSAGLCIKRLFGPNLSHFHYFFQFVIHNGKKFNVNINIVDNYSFTL